MSEVIDWNGMKLAELEIKVKTMLFAGDYFYPFGGWGDFIGFFDSVQEAKEYLEKIMPNCHDRWAHIVEDGKIIVNGDSSDGKWKWEIVINGVD